MARYRPVDPAQSFPELEEQVLARWRERDVFRESIRRREGSPPFVFYEGPAHRQRAPGAHHVLSRVFKDVFPRFKTMRGHFVPRKGGWDCHGLPVELEIEKELGFQSKEDIERYGVAEFNAKCRESVLRYIDEWNALTERIGFWIDTENAYFTLSNDYIESVWWSLKETWEKGLLTEGHKVVPYCPRCGTALSSHEVAQGYEDVVDPSVYVRFPLRDDPGVSLLAWTTMPWTLVPHAAIAVDPEVTYARARLGDERLILAEALVERVLGEEAEIEERMPGSALLGLRYEPPFPYISDYGERGHTVLAGDFVSIEDGTGVVHTGAAFGEDDFRLAQDNGLTIQNPVRPDGTFDDRAGPVRRHVRARRGPARSSRRCASRAGSSAPASTSTPIRTAGAAARRSSTTPRPAGTCAPPRSRTSSWRRTRRSRWYPEHIKHGRFGNWLENNVDWALSRERYWGTAAPDLALRRRGTWCAWARAPSCEERGGEVPDDLHRPYIDEVMLRCATRRGDAPRARPDRRLVGLGLHAVRAVARPLRERGRLPRSASRPTTSARRSTRRAAGSTRCSRSRRSCSGRASYRDRALPRPDPRRRGPEDVEVEGQRGGALGRDRHPRGGRPALVLLHLEAAVGRLPLLAGGGRRVGAPVPQDALEHLRLLRPLRERERRREGAAASPRSSTAGSSRAWPPPPSA